MTQDPSLPPERRGPTLRRAALAIIGGYLLSFGTGFASFTAVPKLLVEESASRTGQNIAAHPGLLSAAIVAMLLNFVGDVLGAWGMYALLRPVSASLSLLAAWLRIVYTAVGLAAVLQLVTAHELVTGAESLAALGRETLDAHVYVALRAFQAQFGFSLVLFGLYLMMAGGLAYASGYVPRWLGAVLAIDGAGWIVSEIGPFLFPGAKLDFLFATSFGELLFLVWLVGWGLRLKEPATTVAPSASRAF
jgi:hypothetical protein